MACDINLFFLVPGADILGSWTFDGYSENFPGTPGSGGSDPGSLTGFAPIINTSGWTPGYYYFTYTVEEEGCDPVTSQVVIAVQESGSTGTGSTETYCSTDDDIIDLFDLLSDASTGGSWVLSPNSLNDPGAAFDSEAGTLDLGQVSSSSIFTFDYVIEIEDEPGFQSSSCLVCKSITQVTVNVNDPCSAGQDVIVNYNEGSEEFVMFNLLGGTPDENGQWEQISGEDPIDILSGYLGIVVLKQVAGCEYKFRYTCPGPPDCRSTATVTFIKNIGLNPVVIIEENVLKLTQDPGCPSAASFQWQVEVNGSWQDISGETDPTLDEFTPGNRYRLVYDCEGCEYLSNVIFIPIDCTCNNLGLAFEFDLELDCLSLSDTGDACSPIDTDVLEYRINGGPWLPADDICGCDLREFLDVNPTCSATTTNISIGFNNPERCSGLIDAVYVKWGDGTLTTEVGSDITSTFFNVSKSDFINQFNRTATIVVRLNLGGSNFLFQEIEFFYSGNGSASSGCNDVQITKKNLPKLYNNIEGRRVTTFSDLCDPIEFIDQWNPPNPCSNFYVLLQQVNLPGGDPGISGTVFNCPNPTRQWYKDGQILTGETGIFINISTYGNGFYEMIASGCGCEGSDSIMIGGCATSLQLTSSLGTYTGTFSGCAGQRQWIWEKFISGQWITQQTATNNNSTNSYTPNSPGDYRLRVICLGNNCTNTVTFTVSVPCSVSISMDQVGSDLVATASGCSGSKEYRLFIWNGAWQQIFSTTTTNNTFTFTPAQSGLYKVEVTCLANDCEAEDQAAFIVTCPDVIPQVTGPVNNVYTGTLVGCTGVKTWEWSRWTGSSWQVEQSVTNGNASNNFTPAVNNSDYRLKVICASNGCEGEVVFFHSEDCDDIIVIIVDNNAPTLNAAQFGCSGAVFYTWYYRPNPGSGSWGSPISTSSAINADNWGPGEFRLDVECGGCSGSSTYIYSNCIATVSVDCNDPDPFTAIPSNATNPTYQWQYSLTGTGWTQNGMSTTDEQFPIYGTGYYRVIMFSDGCPPKTAMCYYEDDCDGSASLSDDMTHCAWTSKTLTGETEQVDFYVAGSSVVSGQYDMSSASDRAALRDDIEAWLSANGHDGTVQVLYGGKGTTTVRIACTSVVPDRMVYDGIAADADEVAHFGSCGMSCEYEFSFDSHEVNYLEIQEEEWYVNINPFTDETGFIAAFNSFISQRPYSGTVSIDSQNNTVTFTTDAAIGALNVPNHNPSLVYATKSNCGPSAPNFPTINLDVQGCSGSYAVIWQYRPNSSAPWTTIQTGGDSLQTCENGDYQAIVNCGDCEYTTNIITVIGFIP